MPYDFSVKGIKSRIVDSITGKSKSRTYNPRTSENFFKAQFTSWKNKLYQFKAGKTDLASFSLKVDETRNVLYQFINITDAFKKNKRTQYILIYDLGADDSDFAFRFYIELREVIEKISSFLNSQFNIKSYNIDFINSISIVKTFVSNKADLVIFMESGIRAFIELDKINKIKKPNENKNYRILKIERPSEGFQVKFVKLPQDFDKHYGVSITGPKISYSMGRFKNGCFLTKVKSNLNGHSSLKLIKDNYNANLVLQNAVKTNHITELKEKETVTEFDLNTTEEIRDIWSNSIYRSINPNKIFPFSVEKQSNWNLLENQQNFFLSKNPFFKSLFYDPDSFLIGLPSKICKITILRPIDRFFTVLKFLFENKENLTDMQSMSVFRELNIYMTEKNCDEILLMVIQLLCQTESKLYYSESLVESLSKTNDDIYATDDFSLNNNISQSFKIKEQYIKNDKKFIAFLFDILFNFSGFLKDINSESNFNFISEKIGLYYGFEYVSRIFPHGLVLYLLRLMR